MSVCVTSGTPPEGGALEDVRCTLQMRSRIGNIEIIPAVQTADYPRDSSPTTTNLGSTWTSANGIVDPAALTDLATVAGGAQLARLGFVTRNTSGTSVATCEVEGTWDLVTRLTAPDVVVPWSPIFSNSTTAAFHPATEWVDVGTARSFRCAWEMRGKTGNFTAWAAYQLCSDPTSPDSAVSIGSQATADGLTWPTSWTVPSLGAKQKIRFGWYGKLTSGSTTALGYLRGRFQRLKE